MSMVHADIVSATDRQVEARGLTGSTFNAQMTALKPFLWIKGNDVPASGTLLDYGNTGPQVPPIGPPHNLSYPAHTSPIAPAFTTDGQPGMQWDSVNQAAGIWTGAATNDLPQGTNWTFLIAAKVPNTIATSQPIWSVCAGNGLDVDGKAVIWFTIYNIGGGHCEIGTYYQGGTVTMQEIAHNELTDGNWHLYALNVYSSTGILQQVMNYDLYIDGVLTDSFQLNSGGISVFYAGGNFASLLDAFRVGGYPAFLNPGQRTTGAMQHFAIFIGGAYAQFGPMLTGAQIAALYAGR